MKSTKFDDMKIRVADDMSKEGREVYWSNLVEARNANEKPNDNDTKEGRFHKVVRTGCGSFIIMAVPRNDK